MKMENIFKQKMMELRILSEISDFLNEKLKDFTTEYTVVGKQEEQAIDWRTGELKWEDDEHTIPYYENKWDYVDIPEDELNEEQKMLVKACKDIAKKLEKLA